MVYTPGIQVYLLLTTGWPQCTCWNILQSPGTWFWYVELVMHPRWLTHWAVVTAPNETIFRKVISDYVFTDQWCTNHLSQQSLEHIEQIHWCLLECDWRSCMGRCPKPSHHGLSTEVTQQHSRGDKYEHKSVAMYLWVITPSYLRAQLLTGCTLDKQHNHDTILMSLRWHVSYCLRLNFLSITVITKIIPRIWYWVGSDLHGWQWWHVIDWC